MFGGRPLATTVLVVATSIVASYFAVAFDREDNRPPAYAPPPTTAPAAPTPTITSDEFVASIASAVVDALDLPPEDEGRIVEVLTDEEQPGVIVVPPPTTTTSTTSTTPTTTTTTTTTPPPPRSIPSVDEWPDTLSTLVP